MKQRAKNIILLILILILAIELFIYFSDFNLVKDRAFEIGIITIFTFFTFFILYFKKWIFKVLTGLPIIIIGIIFFFFQYISAFGSIEKISWNWEIEEYEIIYVNMEYYAGPGGKPYLKLRKKYFFGLIYKTFDKQKPENTFIELGLGKNNCHLKFEKTGMEFDLCKKKRLK